MTWVMLTTYLPTNLPTHLPTHSPTYLLLQPTYLLPTIYNLLGYEINMWNKKLDKNLIYFDGVVHW